MIDTYKLVGIVCTRPQQFAWFLGAGTSAAAGLPTALDVMWDLKRRFYRREQNQDISRQDMQLDAVRAKVSSYALSRGFPEEGDPGEYSKCFEVAYDAKEFTQDRAKNPYLKYHEMQSVLSRSLEVYRGANFGKVPKKITVHKNTEFKEEEILGALDSFREGTEVELVQIVKGVAWKGIKFKPDRSPHLFPVTRGSYLPIDANEALLWTQGGVRGVNLQNSAYEIYKEGSLKPTPSPVLVRRFTGAGGWHDTCAGIIGLTKMDWNNNTLYKKLPVTLVYSKAFADIIQQNPDIVDNVYDFRMFM